MSTEHEPADKEWAQTRKAFATLLEQVTPWLLELGSWIFGALIAFNLLILAALLTVGPVDRAVLIATTAFALALPPDVTGLVLLRLIVDVSKARLDDVAVKAFEEAGFSAQQVEAERNVEVITKQRTRRVLVSCYAILTLSAVLTVVGVTAAFWHMAWWIGVVFLVMTVSSMGVMMFALGSSGSRMGSRAK